MSTIKLNSVHCERLQDSITADEIEVLIGGVVVAGPIGIHKRQTVTLNLAPRAFTGAVSIQLRELDSNSDPDNLGIRVVGDNPVTGVSINFDAADHAFYTVNYTVT
jgi:hypothetical protein